MVRLGVGRGDGHVDAQLLMWLVVGSVMGSDMGLVLRLVMGSVMMSDMGLVLESVTSRYHPD